MLLNCLFACFYCLIISILFSCHKLIVLSTFLVDHNQENERFEERKQGDECMDGRN